MARRPPGVVTRRRRLSSPSSPEPYDGLVDRDAPAQASPVNEDAIQQRGRALLADVQSERLLALTPAWWQERLLAWASADPEFRTRLLRFVDVLPSLRSPGAVADHVRQYFRQGTPALIRVGAATGGAAPFRPALSKVVRSGVATMADRFIGGATPESALPGLRRLAASGAGYTVDLLGEAVLSDDEAGLYAARCADLIAAVGRIAPHPGAPVTRPNISLKLSSLTGHFEPAAPEQTTEAVHTRLLPLLRQARSLGVFVNVDMEQFRFKDLTHTVVETAAFSAEFRNWDGLGIVVQAYLKEAPEDIARLHDLARRRGAPIVVRLVKGAYWDEETVLAEQENRPSPVFEQKAATDASFEKCTTLLLDAWPHLHPAFGTHNPRSIAQAMVQASSRGIPLPDLEFQMLYGMAEGLRVAVRRAGYATRVYVPVGPILPGMAYLVRRLLENTSNESWLMHRHEEGDPAVLLAPPTPSLVSAPVHQPAVFANQSPAEFYSPAVREEMAAALERERSSAGRRFPLIIAAAPVESGSWDEVRSPAAPDAVRAYVARARPDDVGPAVAAAAAAFPEWRDTPASTRAGLLRVAADRLLESRFDFAAAMVMESAKPWAEADGDVIEAVDYLRYYAAEAERVAAPHDLSMPGEDGTYLREARGVAAIIAPWNFPLAIITGMAAAAIAAGCPAILKPAEQSPVVAARLVDLLNAAGFPPGVVNFLPGPGDVGRALAEHPGVDVIAFTGSNAVGLEIVRAAAVVAPGQRNIKHVIAEMGGKNAIIVDEDADIDQAVAGVIASAFGFAGQKCSACSRVIVVGTAIREFEERLAAAVRSLPAGAPEDPYTVVPPVISAEARSRIEEYIELGRHEGVVLATGPSAGPGHYVTPHVFTGISRTSPLVTEEIFGPVLVLFGVPTFSEALDLALDSRFALTGGVYSRNPRNLARARAEFRVGNLYLNRKITGAVVGRQPFGGFAMSGLGTKAGGPDYLAQFMVPRVVTENTMRRGFAPGA